MEKTAIDWLQEKFSQTPKPIYNSDIDKLFEEAKAMFRQQIEDAYAKGLMMDETAEIDAVNKAFASDYYTTKYGG